MINKFNKFFLENKNEILLGTVSFLLITFISLNLFDKSIGAVSISFSQLLIVFFSAFIVQLYYQLVKSQEELLSYKIKLSGSHKEKYNYEKKISELKVEYALPLLVMKKSSIVSSCLIDSYDNIIWYSNSFKRSFNIIDNKLINLKFEQILSSQNIINTSQLTGSRKKEKTIQLADGQNLYLKIKYLNVKDKKVKLVEFIPSFDKSIENLPKVWSLNESIEDIYQALSKIHLKGIQRFNNNLILGYPINLHLPEDLVQTNLLAILKAILIYASQNKPGNIETTLSQIGKDICLKISINNHSFSKKLIDQNLIDNKAVIQPLSFFMNQFEKKTAILDSKIAIKNIRTHHSKSAVFEISFRNSIISKKIENNLKSPKINNKHDKPPHLPIVNHNRFNQNSRNEVIN